MKLIIFDLDGVLVDSKDLHYQALNLAIAEVNPGWMISYQEHLSRYNGNPTSVKLDMLAETYPSFNDDDRAVISEKKQEITRHLIGKIPADQELVQIMTELRRSGIDIAVASNSIRSTVDSILKALGVYPLVGFIASNEDVSSPKPDPEIYFKCMEHFGVEPQETIILEDSDIGRAGALATGSRMVPINSRKDITLEMINSEIRNSAKINVLIPMAGAGTRFAEAGYELPKPLIDVEGKPMIQAVVDSLNVDDARYTFIVQKEHYEKHDLLTVLAGITHSPNIVIVDGMTEGAAATALLAEHIIDNDMPLVIANSDQIVEIDMSSMLYQAVSNEADGCIVTFNDSDPKWSYAKIENNLVVEVAEKQVISDNATVGIYYWRHGSDFVKYAKQMIDKDIRVNNEFYICPVYNEAIEANKVITSYPVLTMWGTGTPEDLEKYLRRSND
jgi:HAD superfamily hydrolase (TIGR01509 family)